MATHRELVEEVFRATADSDAEAAIAVCHEEVEHRITGLDTYFGHNGIREYVQDQALVVGIDRRIQEIVEQGEVVATERIDTFIFKEGPLIVPVAAFFRFKDGLIVDWQDYHDLLRIARMLGH